LPFRVAESLPGVVAALLHGGVAADLYAFLWGGTFMAYRSQIHAQVVA
jgi:hypothetical protein